MLTSIYLLIEQKIPYGMVCLASTYVIPHQRYERLNLEGNTHLIEKTILNLLIAKIEIMCQVVPFLRLHHICFTLQNGVAGGLVVTALD